MELATELLFVSVRFPVARATARCVDRSDVSDDHTRGLGVLAKPEYHGGGEYGTLVQLRRAEAAEGKRGQENRRGGQGRRMMSHQGRQRAGSRKQLAPPR